MNAKERIRQKKIHQRLRVGIQAVFFFLMPSAFTAAFSGIKYVFAQLGAGEMIAVSAFMKVLMVLCIYTIVFGRFFCGFACAFGTLGDAVYGVSSRIRKKRKKRAFAVPKPAASVLRYGKYVVLAVISLLCFLGIYQRMQGSSPWTAFSMLHAGNLKPGGYGVGLVVLILIAAGMAWQERFFCRFLCPMGAVFSMLPVLPVFSLVRSRESCISKCSACIRQCPAGISLPDEKQEEETGECFQCQKCMDTCPGGNVHSRTKRVKGNEIWFTLLRAICLYILLVILGI